MSGISSQALPSNAPNRIKFNGYEQQNKEFSDGSGLEWYDYKNRFYDNQIGRFFVQDRLANEYVYYTPYQFAGNEVPNAIDLDGLEPYYANPRQIFYQAAEKLTFAAANLMDKVGAQAEVGVTVFKSIFSSSTVNVKDETTAKIGVQIQPTFTSALGKIKAAGDNGISLSNVSLFDIKVTPEFTKGLVVEGDIGVASVQQEVAINNMGVIEDKTGGNVNFTISGVPLTIGLTTSNFSNGQSETGISLGVRPMQNTSLGLQFKQTKNTNNTTTGSGGLKFEVSTPGTTGVKLFGGINLFTTN